MGDMDRLRLASSSAIVIASSVMAAFSRGAVGQRTESDGRAVAGAAAVASITLVAEVASLAFMTAGVKNRSCVA